MNALSMWHQFLSIQEKIFGEERKEMVTTFKKLAAIYAQVGNPQTAATYYEKTQKYLI